MPYPLLLIHSNSLKPKLERPFSSSKKHKASRFLLKKKDLFLIGNFPFFELSTIPLKNSLLNLNFFQIFLPYSYPYEIISVYEGRFTPSSIR